MIRVLVADHQPIVNYGIRMLFDSSNDIKIVSTVDTAKQLINYLKKGSVDVVLMSMDLPDMNGITILRKIKKNYNNVRVIIFSAQPENIYASSGIRAGASGFLSKTASTNTIKNAILKVYKGGMYVTNAMAQKLTFDKNIDDADLYHKLSTREIEVLKLICNGKKNNQIAEELNINPKTVSTYKSRLMTKLNVTNLISLIDLGRLKN
ncbi:MAG: response regulator transcription factor [Bacteroidetes bacterium]|nr:response regulator transcription factor [Bacteroidota bacterium]MDA0860604.1 response regulator transcription factor [Bacteroidota bacterium]MDA1318368.1 response regulator transcription factor [Bacteroidota bacterium]